MSNIRSVAWEPPYDKLLSVSGPSLVLQMGVVITSCPLAVLDLSGGCCRPLHPFSSKRAVPFDAMPDMYKHFVQRGSCDAPVSFARVIHWLDGWSTLLRDIDDVHNYPEHRELFLCLSARSGTFYHALGQVAVRILFALSYLRRSTHTRILATGPIIADVVDALGIPIDRLILWRAGVNEPRKLLFRAQHVLIPPPLDELDTRALRPPWARPLLRRMRDIIIARATNASVSSSMGANVLIVQRSSQWADGTPKRGRALLNHEEVVRGLRQLFVGRRVVTFPPASRPLLEQVRDWNAAAFVIAPHGAGLTNLLFLPLRGTVGVLELRAAGHKGAVYHQLALSAAVRHEECLFNASDVLNSRRLLLEGPDANVALPMPFILRCMQQRYGAGMTQNSPTTVGAVFSPAVFRRMESLLFTLSWQQSSSAEKQRGLFSSQQLLQCLRLCDKGPKCGHRPQAVACIDSALRAARAALVPRRHARPRAR